MSEVMSEERLTRHESETRTPMYSRFLMTPWTIQEQAGWGRLLNDPDWGEPPPVTAIAKAVPFADITDDYERSVRRFNQPL